MPTSLFDFKTKAGRVEISANGNSILKVSEQEAHLWRAINDAEEVLFVENVAFMFTLEPRIRVDIPISPTTLIRLFNTLAYTYLTDTPFQVLDRIDASLRTFIRRGAATIQEDMAWWGDEDYPPIEKPIIVIWPRRNWDGDHELALTYFVKGIPS